MGTADPFVVLLHGAGETQSAWDQVIAELPDGWQVHAVDLEAVGMDGDGRFDLDAAAGLILQSLPANSPTLVCGLSLGAMIAARIAAIDSASVVDGLILSGGQVKAPRWMMRLQWHISTWLVPARAFTSLGSTKPTTMAMYEAAEAVDLRSDLGSIRVPTAVWCGTRDVANTSAARELATGIPKSELRFIPGMGHGWHQSHPRAFAAHIRQFVSDSAVFPNR